MLEGRATITRGCSVGVRDTGNRRRGPVLEGGVEEPPLLSHFLLAGVENSKRLLTGKKAGRRPDLSSHNPCQYIRGHELQTDAYAACKLSAALFPERLSLTTSKLIF